MKDTLETRLGLFFALALVAFAIMLEMVGSFDKLKPGLILQARFNNILELKVGDPVKLAGKQIGYVEDLRFADQKVLVIMKITDPTATIRTDSKATIKFSGLLGQNYISLDFGTPEGAPVTSGTELATVEQPDLNQLMAKMENVANGIQRLTDSFSDINFEELLTPFKDFLEKSGPRFEQILTNAAAITAQIRSGKGTIGRLIYDPTLYDQALDTMTNLSQAGIKAQTSLDDVRSLIAQVKQGKGTVGRLMTDETLYHEATKAASELRQIFEKINKGQGTIGKLVNDPNLVDEATLTLRKVDKATEGLEDQGPLSVIGILVNPLF